MDTEVVDYEDNDVTSGGGRTRAKGRGHQTRMESADDSDRGGTYEQIESGDARKGGAAKCRDMQLFFVV